MQTRYDLNLVLYSLEHQAIHPEISDSNLGDNVAYLLETLSEEDLQTVIGSLETAPDSVASQDIFDKHFEIGHYLQALEDCGPVPAGSYGIIASITPRLRGLFYDNETGRLRDVPFSPNNVGVIFGTYII